MVRLFLSLITLLIRFLRYLESFKAPIMVRALLEMALRSFLSVED
jgi:hypothetical protein